MTAPPCTEQKPPLEDWVGSDLDHANRFEVHRGFNGIIVRGHYDIRTDSASSDKMLVFQNPEHFWSWVQSWLAKTGGGGT